MDNDEFDFYFWAMEYSGIDFDNHNVGISKITSINPFNVGQMLRKPNKLDESDFSLFLIENICLLVIILIGYFLTVTVNFTFLKLVKRRCSLHDLLAINRTRLSSSGSFKIAVLSLAFTFFLFFNLSILTNMIKTQKVTVSTSEFIDSISKINRTTKTLVTFEINSMHLFNRLFYRKPTDAITSSDYANFDDFYSKLSKRGVDTYFFFMKDSYFFASIYYVTLLNTSIDDYFAFLKPTIYYESFKAFLYRKNLDQKRKKILNHKWVFVTIFYFIFDLK